MKVTIELTEEQLKLLIVQYLVNVINSNKVEIKYPITPKLNSEDILIKDEDKWAINEELLNECNDMLSLVNLYNSIIKNPQIVFNFTNNDGSFMLSNDSIVELIAIRNGSTYVCLDNNPPMEGCWKKLTKEQVIGINDWFTAPVERERINYEYIQLRPSNKLFEYLNSNEVKEIWLFHDIAILSGWAGYLIIDKDNNKLRFANIMS